MQLRQTDFDAFLRLEEGIKTGMYYLRTKAATDAIKFTVETVAEPKAEIACALNREEECAACSA